MGNDKELEKLQRENRELITENESLEKAQQGFKAKIKELTDLPPRIISGHKSESVKYVRQMFWLSSDDSNEKR